MKAEQAEQKLIAMYESMYKVPDDLTFKEPDKPLLDPKMIKHIEKIYNKMKEEHCDWWTVVVGPEGSGKSTFTIDMLWHYCQFANKDFLKLIIKNTAFEDTDLLKFIKYFDVDTNFEFILADEGANVFFNRDSMSVTRKLAMNLVNSMRFLSYFVCVCSVDLSQLDTIIRDHRVKTLIHIEKQGTYHYYNRDQIIRLLNRNKSTRDSQFKWHIVEPEFMGEFIYNSETKRIVDMLKKQYMMRMKLKGEYEFNRQVLKMLGKYEKYGK